MRKVNQSGIAGLEVILVIVLIAIVGFTGYYVWHAQKNTDKTLIQTGNSQVVVPASKITTFAECKAAKSSVMQETYPEKCVTKDGETFVNDSAPSMTSDSVQAVTFTSLPSDLKTAVLANAPCASSGRLLDESGQPETGTDHYVSDKAAFVLQCQSVAFYAFSSDKWMYITRSQEGYDCNLLRKYSVPVALVVASVPNGECISNTSTGGTTTYQL